MKISLIKALKSPLEKRFSIPCVIWAVMTTWVYTYMQITKNLSFTGYPLTHCLMLLPYVAGLIITIGYFSSFSHNAVLGKKVLFNIPLRTLFANGIKTFLFTLCTYLVVFSGEILAFVSIKYLPTGLDLFAFIFIQAFMFLYLLVAWTLFIDTLRMTQPLRIVSIFDVLGKNWPSYLKMTLYMIIAILILAVPTGILKLFILLLAQNYSWTSVIGIFISSFLYLYPTFVILHIMAQGYADIRNNTSNTDPKQKDILATNHITKTKVVSKKKTLVSKQPTKAKQISKNTTPKSRKSTKKVK